MDIRVKTKSQNSSIVASPISPTKKAKKEKCKELNLFDVDPKDFEFGSPSKKPLNNDISNPTFKPFKEISNQVHGLDHNNDSSSYQSNSKSIKSEDDSPLRKRMFQSPVKKKNRNTSQKQIERVIGESRQVD